MPFLWKSEFYINIHIFLSQCVCEMTITDLQPPSRYEIDNGAASWEVAEKQIRSGGASTVSVKSSSSAKRKKGESAREIYDKEIESKRQKVIKKGTEGRKKR